MSVKGKDLIMAHGMGEHDKGIVVREPAWHGLSDVLDQAPDRITAEALVHNYKVDREPLYRLDVNSGDYYMSDDYELNVRRDTQEVFDMVPRTRVDPQPNEVWDVVESAMKIDGFGRHLVVETAGTYNGGADMYVLLKLDRPLTVIGDKYGQSVAYIAFQNAYTRNKALRVQPTNVRIVCQNMSNAADFSAEAAGMNLSLAHTQNLLERMTELEEKLQAWLTGVDLWREAKEDLAKIKVTTDQTKWFVEQLMWMPELASERVQDNVKLARVELIGEYFADFNDGVRGTALGLFEAASSYQGHVREAQNKMTRFKRTMLTPDTTLRQAADLAREAALV